MSSQLETVADLRYIAQYATEVAQSGGIYEPPIQQRIKDTLALMQSIYTPVSCDYDGDDPHNEADTVTTATSDLIRRVKRLETAMTSQIDINKLAMSRVDLHDETLTALENQITELLKGRR